MRSGVCSSDVCSSDLLLIGYRVHEDEHVALRIEILEILGVEPDALYRLGGPETDVVLAPVDQVLEFHLHIGAALAGLGMLDLHGAPQAAVIFDVVAGTNLDAADLHGKSLPICQFGRASGRERGCQYV